MSKYLYSPDTPAGSEGYDDEAVGLLSEYAYLEAITDPKARYCIRKVIINLPKIISCHIYIFSFRRTNKASIIKIKKPPISRKEGDVNATQRLPGRTLNNSLSSSSVLSPLRWGLIHLILVLHTHNLYVLPP